ncbi:beta-galactosidase GalA [Opitutus sp. ER46]|uniref:beta-galactosidase GalA n=1 Tax=Opitutus sp. ER46 TaxID=2161864 RepID=UPI000D318AD9|nr:beta-galactosidase GalA [Opitutus sp. ER46]PTX98538.1 beta-galactosidase [Opitutus sp. ER46]
MRTPLPWLRLLLTLTAFALALPRLAAASRERILFDADWRFALGHATDPARDFNHATGYFSYLAKTGYGDGPASPVFDDRAWRRINLPHDFAVEAPFDPRGTASHGFKGVGRQAPEGSVGWYRKTFRIGADELGRRFHLQLDGAYRAARVFINGFFVGEEPSGYLGVSYDLTDYLRYGADNVIAVRVDATMEEGWFYEGAGIYRHVWLVKTAPVYVAADGTWVRTDLTAAEARATVETQLVNAGAEPVRVDVVQTVLDPEGRAVAETSTSTAVSPGPALMHTTQLRVPAPRLWSLEQPTLYRLVTVLRRDGREIDRYETSFGFRTVRFEPDRGFFLNGQRVTIKGTNNHQDHAGVGVALPDALQAWRIRRLKEMGSNAYRCSHHPPTPELLEACDRQGMLVIDETRLMGSSPYHLTQLERMIRRDRNHPSIILWSVGNEEWAIEGNITGARLAATMQRTVNRLDPTRLANAAVSGGWGGISSVIQAVGVNYIKQADPDRQHATHPWQVLLGTEETTTQQTRGIYFDARARAHLSPQADGTSGGNAELGWKFYAARPWAAGVLFWTGFDYRGEPTPFGWPAVASQFGILDTCGFPKDGFFYLQAWWTQEPVLHVFPHWNWPDRIGQPLTVTVHSNCEEVELWLNGASLGRQRMEPNGHLSWTVSYQPGELVARGYRDGREVRVATRVTTGEPAALRLQPDRTTLAADGRDVAVVTVRIDDHAGREVPTAAVPVRFAVRGPGRIIGVGNGDPSCHEPDVVFAPTRAVPLGAWRAPDPAVREGVIEQDFVFDRPVLAAGEHLTLLLNALGTRQSVHLNGKPLQVDVDPAAARAEVALAADDLKPTGNVLRITATRYAEWRDREGLAQFHPAVLRVEAPAPEWRRTTFNGLAQVLVQTTGEPGEILLEASAPPLRSAAIVIKATHPEP